MGKKKAGDTDTENDSARVDKPALTAGRRRAVEALQESEARHSLISENTGDAIWLLDLVSGKFRYVSPSVSKLRGYSVPEVLEQTLEDALTPDSYQRIAACLLRRIEALSKGDESARVQRHEVDQPCKDGSIVPTEVVTTLLTDERGQVVEILGVSRDITERKRAEDALRDSEEKFRKLADSANTGILLVQGEEIIYINEALARMGGYTVEECKQLKYWDLALPDRREYIRWAGNARQHGWVGPSRSELKLIRKNGDEIWLDCSWAIPTLGGKPTVLVMCVDITARKRAESEVVKAKAQAELYLDLMGHDINNLNQIAQGFLEIALETLDLPPKQKELIEKPLAALQSSSRIIANLRMLQKAESGEIPSKTVDICGVLEDLKARYSSTPGRNVTVNFEHSHPCYVPANELIGDVFSNIMGNAIKHSDPRKPLVIDVEIDSIVWDEKGYFRVAIEDNGPGISDESKEKLFSRFKRGETRASGKGLGLYIALTLVRNFQGKLWVEDRVHGDYTKGARVIVLLPVAQN